MELRLGVLLIAATLLRFSPTAGAQFYESGTDSSQIMEEEVSSYMHEVAFAFHRCDASWFAAQLLPVATIQGISTDGRQESFTPAEFVKKRFVEFCQPYEAINVRWDEIVARVSRRGAVTSVTWDLAWGGQPGERGRLSTSSKLLFENWVDLVKDHRRIRIAALGWRDTELVPGGEEEYQAYAHGGRLFYRLNRFYDGVVDGLSAFFRAARDRLRRPQAREQATQRDDGLY